MFNIYNVGQIFFSVSLAEQEGKCSYLNKFIEYV